MFILFLTVIVMLDGEELLKDISILVIMEEGLKRF
jgi:hypothetical protein